MSLSIGEDDVVEHRFEPDGVEVTRRGTDARGAVFVHHQKDLDRSVA